MIYPMMMKVDFRSIKNVGRNPKGLFVTWITNWIIKPFTMYGIASLFFFVLFKGFVSPDLATEYLAGAVLLGAAPCTAMVFVWSTLTDGDPAYTVVQVATNDLIILVAFVPIAKFLLGVSTENLLIEARAKKMAIEAEKLTADNIYKVLIYFEKLYAVMDEQEKRQIMESLISEIQIYEERQPNGQWLKSIKFKLPIIAEDICLSLDNDAHMETVCLLSKS